jgi:hypothetical protein
MKKVAKLKGNGKREWEENNREGETGQKQSRKRQRDITVQYR